MVLEEGISNIGTSKKIEGKFSILWDYILAEKNKERIRSYVHHQAQKIPVTGSYNEKSMTLLLATRHNTR